MTRIKAAIDIGSTDSIMMYGRKMDVIIKSGEVEPPEAAKSARHAKPAEPAKTQEPAEPAKLAETKNPAKSEETEKAVKLLKPLKAAISLDKEGKAVIINGVGYTPGKCDNESLKLLFEKWWRSEALDYLKARIEIFYPVVQKHDVRMPAIALRKMKTVWGSCSLKNKKITFSYYLAAVEPSCIDYVVLHELVHLIHPNHSRQFYSFLGTYMPDWKKRREALRRYSVCSLPFPAK